MYMVLLQVDQVLRSESYWCVVSPILFKRYYMNQQSLAEATEFHTVYAKLRRASAVRNTYSRHQNVPLLYCSYIPCVHRFTQKGLDWTFDSWATNDDKVTALEELSPSPDSSGTTTLEWTLRRLLRLRLYYNLECFELRRGSTSSLSHFFELYGAASVALMWFSIVLSLLLSKSMTANVTEENNTENSITSF